MSQRCLTIAACVAVLSPALPLANAAGQARGRWTTVIVTSTSASPDQTPPSEAAPSDVVPSDGAPSDATPSDGAPSDGSPADTVPGGHAGPGLADGIPGTGTGMTSGDLLGTVMPGGSAKNQATVGANGLARAPKGAPALVVAAIRAGNRIAKLPYVWGGGHQRWTDRGYDCSGSVSYVLHAAALLSSPRTSGGLKSWGVAGRGRWISVYATRGHTFAVIAGLRFDTGGRTGSTSRWQADSRPTRGYAVRHAMGL